MAASNKKLSSPKEGMNRDSHEAELKETEYSFALNVNFQDEHGNGPVVLQNESSNIKCTGFKSGYKVIGHKYDINGDRTYFFLTNPTTGDSEIGYISSFYTYTDLQQVENSCNCNISVILENPLEKQIRPVAICTYTTIISDFCTLTGLSTGSLNFSIDYPIFENNIHIKDEKSGKVIYFTDNLNPPRYIQLDNISYYFTDIDECTNVVTDTCLNVDKMRIFKLFEKPCLKVESIRSGGKLRAGMIEVLLAYCDKLGNNISNYYSMTNPIAIFDRNNNILDQTNLDYFTDKAISLSVSNLDSNYDYYKIAVVSKSGLDASVSYYEYNTYPIDNLRVIITSLNGKKQVSFDDLISQKPFYITSKGMSDSNGTLFQYGLKEHREVNLQPVVNLMGSLAKWGTLQAKEDLYMEGENVSNYKSAMRDEVYPYSIRFFFNGGYTTANFPLISRPPKPIEIELMSTGDKNYQSINAYTSNCNGTERDKYWQYNNTATVDPDLCTIPAGSGETTTITRVNELSCVVSVAGEASTLTSIPSGDITINSELSLVSYINTNIEAIKVSTDPQFDDIKYILNNPSTYIGSCTPEFGTNCSEELTLVEEDMFAISVDEETSTLVQWEDDMYTEVQSPSVWNYWKPDSSGNIQRNTTFENDYMPMSSVVYVKSNPLPNITCGSATALSTLQSPQIDIPFYFQDFGATTSAALITTIASTYYSAEFGNFLNKSALWFKAEFNGEDKILVDLSRVKCDSSDSNTGNTIRISVYDSCGATSDITSYSLLVSDFDTNVTRLELNKTDFTTDYAYIAIDTALKMRGVLKYTLAPPCGNFNMYQRAVEYSQINSFINLTFGKKQTYSSVCTYTIPKLGDCDPVPYQKGEFSYWESTEKYPCNSELYDSSNLIIKSTDLSALPADYVTKFEDYFVLGSIGTEYILSTEANFMDKPIRHFKYPDNKISPFMSTQNQTPSNFGDSVIYPIGFNLTADVIRTFLDIAVNNDLLTLSERLAITGYEIFIGDRRVEKSVIAKGICFDVYRSLFQGEMYSNYPLNALGNDSLNGQYQGHPFGSTSNNIFTFHSPNIHFNKPTLTREIAIDGYLVGKGRMYFDEVLDHPTYIILGDQAKSLATSLAILESALEVVIQSSNWTVTAAAGGVSSPAAVIVAAIAIAAYVIMAIKKTGQYRLQWLQTFTNMGKPNNFAYYQTVVGHYSTFMPNNQGDSLLRSAEVVQYLKEGYWNVSNEYNGNIYKINNVGREDSVLISFGDSYRINYPGTIVNYDNTNYSLDNSSRRLTDTLIGKAAQYTTNASSPYVTMKQYNPSQYGGINSISWLSTGFCGDINDNSECNTVLGGDIFISRFAVKRKFPFFKTDAFGLAPLTPFEYSSNFNINPHLNTASSGRFFIDHMINDPDNYSSSFLWPSIGSTYNLHQLSGNEGFYVKPPSKFFLYSYGIPYFLVESEYNMNYRYAKREYHENFYPNVNDVIDWTQEKNLSIKEPNTYFYNTVYSSTASEVAHRVLPTTYNRLQYDALSIQPNGVIYSEPDSSDNDLIDPWLIYKPLNTYQFPKSFGKLIEMDGIESEQILARFTNGVSIFGSVDQIRDRLTPETKNLGQGGIFAGRAVDFSKTDLGYAGTQHNAKISCDFGHFWVDAKRGKVFNIAPGGKSLDEITSGLEKWFKENLPFKILNSFPNIDIDNNFKGLGIAMGWDERQKRLFLTKKDYSIINDTLEYDEEVGFYVDAPCPTGYTLLNGVCTKITTTSKVPQGTPITVVNSKSTAYGWRYPALYDAYNPDGTALVDGMYPTGYTYEYLLNAFWTGNGIIYNNYVNRLAKTVSMKETSIILTGTSGTCNIELNGVGYLATFNTSLTQTATDFITTHGITLAGLGYSVTQVGPKLIFRFATSNPTTFGVTTLTGNLAFIFYGINQIPSNVWYGATSIVSIPTTKTYYIFVVADNKFRFSIDGVVALESDWTTMQPQHTPNNSGDTIAFVRGHIYPVELTAGCHDIKVEGWNFGGDYMFGSAIFDNSKAELIAATSDADLNVIYSTETETIFYESVQEVTCPDTFVDITPGDICGVCQKVETTYAIQEIALGNPTYFKECSWTVGYSPLLKTWISYYSFKPNYYIAYNNYFQTGINYSTTSSEIGLWTHLPFLSSYQVFYGKLYPFTVEFPLTTRNTNSVLTDIEYWLDVRKYYNKWDFTDIYGSGFNKAIVYNSFQNSGQLKLNTQINNNLSQQISYPKFNTNSIDILQSEIAGKYSFNYLYNLIRNERSGLPIWINDCAQIDKVLDSRLLDYRNNYKDRLRGDHFLIRLTNDVESRFKMLFRFMGDTREYYEQ